MPTFGSVLGARLQQTAVAVKYLDASLKVELFSILSMACCILGAENTSYMLTTNRTLNPSSIYRPSALLGIICASGGSETQLVAFCLFCFFTTITDIIQMCARPNGWAGLWSAINLVCKLCAAMNASSYSVTFRRLAGDYTLEAAPEGSYQGYQRPLASEDYQAMATEAAEKHANIAEGSAGTYRANELVPKD
ncbi:MAG: hypothetical protein SGPRY_003604 [Prymnesium sp.]